MRLARLLPLLALFAVLAGVSTTRAQDDEDAKKRAIKIKATKDLLDKARTEYSFFQDPNKNEDNKTIAYWAAIKYEMDLGKFDVAALLLKRMLGKDPLPELKNDPEDKVNKALVKIEEAEGMSAFLRLGNVRPADWSDYAPFRKEALANVKVRGTKKRERKKE